MNIVYMEEVGFLFLLHSESSEYTGYYLKCEVLQKLFLSLSLLILFYESEFLCVAWEPIRVLAQYTRQESIS